MEVGFCALQVYINVLSFYQLLLPAQGCIACSVQNQSLYCIWGSLVLVWFLVENLFCCSGSYECLGSLCISLVWGFSGLCAGFGGGKEEVTSQMAECGVACYMNSGYHLCLFWACQGFPFDTHLPTLELLAHSAEEQLGIAGTVSSCPP